MTEQRDATLQQAVGFISRVRYVREENALTYHAAFVGVATAFCGAAASRRPGLRLLYVPPRGSKYQLCRPCGAAMRKAIADLGDLSPRAGGVITEHLPL